MISIPRSLAAVMMLVISAVGASAQPPPNDTVSKSTPNRPGESVAADPTGKSAAATTTKGTGEKVDSRPSRDSNGPLLAVTISRPRFWRARWYIRQRPRHKVPLTFRRLRTSIMIC